MLFNRRALVMVLAVVSVPMAGGFADPSIPSVNFQALRLAVEDMARTFPQRYPDAGQLLDRIDAYRRQWPDLLRRAEQGRAQAAGQLQQIAAFARRVLLSNPLLDFDRLLVIRRTPIGYPRRPHGTGKGLGEFLGLPRQSSWQQDTIPKRDGWDNQIDILSDLRRGGKLTVLYRPPGKRLIGDLDLNYDADRLLFSMPDDKLDWQVCQLTLSDRRVEQLTPSRPAGIHHFDACYLPDGRIAFVSTAPLQGVPCNAAVNVAMAYRMDADGSHIQRLCFDQDHNYCLTVTNDGRILYLRWEYTDIPHVWGRYLFTMNPDGTGQQVYYGSGSFWPNGIFYARPIPGHPTMVVGIVTGHHVGRVGELVLFDPARGRSGTAGVLQRIPGRGRSVQPLIQDRLTRHTWPKFLHPYPLSDKYFLVAAKPTPADLWGIYLVDVFDNITLIKQVEGQALLEPIPLRPRPRPPVIPDRIDPTTRQATVYLENIYAGPGLDGVPHGTVKKLRLFTYHFGFQHLAGIVHRVGADGPWEPRRILGTVDVQPDGSAMFTVPADTPLSIQPLGPDGSALQLMRSWTTARPGETVSCVGCHENTNSTPANRHTLAARQPAPQPIQPWLGPPRIYDFTREVQPVLDRFCVGCHDGRADPAGRPMPDFRRQNLQHRWAVLKNTDPCIRYVADDIDRLSLHKQYGGVFPPSYIALRRYVRVGGFESDIRLLNPREFGANTCQLIQMLAKGHHGVQLDDTAWQRLFTWIDLNAPCHGTWTDVAGPAKTEPYCRQRVLLAEMYGGETSNYEQAVTRALPPITPILPPPRPNKTTTPPRLDHWPLTADQARRLQASGGPIRRTIDLGEGVRLELVRIPAGRFVMGQPRGCDDEQPACVVHIDRPFWLSRCEITNRQFHRFDPTHDSRYEHKGSWSFSEHHLGWPLNRPDQPVVRVSWQQAMAFCRWLAQRTGMPFTLPTEAQWEYACRAGTDSPFWWGDGDTDFAPFANLADQTIRQLAFDTDGRFTADLTPRDDRFNDQALVSTEVGRYRPNPWNLCDMHGNVWEWTASLYRPYPWRDDDGRNDLHTSGRRVVRGGSWYDRPTRARSAFRLAYPQWQRIYNVGFRVACPIGYDQPLTTVRRRP